MTLTDEQERILRHMLGINRPELKLPIPTRDYYCANPGNKDLLELEALGAVECYRKCGTYFWYTTTEAGRLAGIKSHRKIRYGRDQRRYDRFLEAKDAFSDLTFREFLTHPYFKEAREGA